MQHLYGKLSVVTFPVKKEESNVIVKIWNRLQMNSTNFLSLLVKKLQTLPWTITLMRQLQAPFQQYHLNMPRIKRFSYNLFCVLILNE